MEVLAEPLSDDVLGFVTKSGFAFKGRISTNDFALCSRLKKYQYFLSLTME